MASPFDTLDACEAKLDQAKVVIAKTRKVAAVVSGVAVAGAFGLLLWKIFGDDSPPTPEPDGSAPPNEGE